jgi:hypothetical protein
MTVAALSTAATAMLGVQLAVVMFTHALHIVTNCMELTNKLMLML